MRQEPRCFRVASEPIAIPYRSPIDRRIHRYFVDFYLKTVGGTYLIEIKPERFTKPPEPRKKTKSTYKRLPTMVSMKQSGNRQKNFVLTEDGNFKIITEKKNWECIINSRYRESISTNKT